MANQQQPPFSLSEPVAARVSRRRATSELTESVEATPVSQKSFSKQDIRSAVQCVVEECCTPGVWLRILPTDEDDNDSIWFHTGLEWADVQPCLQECGLLTTPGRFGGKLIVPEQTWKTFAEASGGVFEVGNARRMAGPVHFFVMRKPTRPEERKFLRPIDQLDANLEVTRLALSEPADDRQRETLDQLRQYFRRCRIHLHSKPMPESA